MSLSFKAEVAADAKLAVFVFQSVDGQFIHQPEQPLVAVVGVDGLFQRLASSLCIISMVVSRA